MTHESDEAAIRSLIEDWRQAVCRGDMAQVLARHSGDLVMFDVPQPLQAIGLDAYRETWELFFADNPPGADRFVLDQLRVFADERVAFAHALLTICGSARCRLTLGLCKLDAGWCITHEHHSMPL